MDTPVEKAFHRLKLRQLELVCVLSETGSVRGASERMHASPPALSKSLREVERMTGVALFSRSTHGLKLTPPGEAFVEHARAILQRIPGLRASTREASTLPPPSVLRIGTAPYVAWQLLPMALERMAAERALPRIQFVEARVMTLADQLVHGDLDAILTLLTPEAVELLSSATLTLDQVRVEKLFVVAAPDQARQRVTWAQLAQRRWILPPSAYTARIFVQRAFLAAGVLPPEPYIESHNIPATLALVRRGLGIAAVYESAVRADLASGAVARVRVNGGLESVPIGLAYRKRAAYVSAIRMLRTALQQ